MLLRQEERPTQDGKDKYRKPLLHRLSPRIIVCGDDPSHAAFTPD